MDESVSAVDSTAKPVGRPSLYSDELADRICERLAGDESERQICEDLEMPDRSTLRRWRRNHEDFAAKCARAREDQAHTMADLVLDTAKACTPASFQADKVKIAAFQWRAEKLNPKAYGTRIHQEVTGKDGGPVQYEDTRDRNLRALEQVSARLAGATVGAASGNGTPAPDSGDGGE